MFQREQRPSMFASAIIARESHTFVKPLRASGNNLVRTAGETTTSRLQSCGRTIAFEQLWIEEDEC